MKCCINSILLEEVGNHILWQCWGGEAGDILFVVRDGHLYTPRCTDGALQGITRDIVMDLAVDMGMPVTACALTPYDLYTADECFLTGSGAELIPVGDVDGRPVRHCPGYTFSVLAEVFTNLISRETSKTDG